MHYVIAKLVHLKLLRSLKKTKSIYFSSSIVALSSLPSTDNRRPQSVLEPRSAVRCAVWDSGNQLISLGRQAGTILGLKKTIRAEVLLDGSFLSWSSADVR